MLRIKPRLIVRGLALVVALGLAASGTTAAGGAMLVPQLALPPQALSSLVASQVAGDQQLSVTWSYSNAGAPATQLQLDLYFILAGVPWRVGSAVVGRTVEPDSYMIPVYPGQWAVLATPRNATGFGPPSVSTLINVTNPCTSATLCARVTTAPVSTTVRLAAQGFLLGLTDDWGAAQNMDRVTPLKPQAWRFAGAASAPTASKLGVSETQLLSNIWNSATAPSNGGYARTPWSDWAAWDSFVRYTVSSAKAQGWDPEFWDVWNEPNGTCCPRFSPADLLTMTQSRWLQAYDIAWRAIKAVDPKAKVVGPSLSALQWAPGAPAEFDLDTFLADAAANGIVWDAISWHESTLAPSPGDISASILNLDRHLAMARAVMDRHPGTVAGNRILVNEYGAPEVHTLAGWNVGYFRAFEDGGVTQANRACWSPTECTNGLDGLLTGSGERTAAWWAHKFYADLSSGTRMTVKSTASWHFDGLASRTDSTRTVRVLLGRHWWCNRPANWWCSYDAGIAAASAAVTIDWPYGTAPVKVVTTSMPAGTGAVGSPPIVAQVTAWPTAGTLTVTLPAVNDGDAISIVAAPS